MYYGETTLPHFIDFKKYFFYNLKFLKSRCVFHFMTFKNLYNFFSLKHGIKSKMCLSIDGSSSGAFIGASATLDVVLKIEQIQYIGFA